MKDYIAALDAKREAARKAGATSAMRRGMPWKNSRRTTALRFGGTTR